ncbi:MAG: hypothetical protein JWO20_1019 [Candidatus Angelobacter sp.]|nr:hypothetical protein [Candidatus Angelobacter sp.]
MINTGPVADYGPWFIVVAAQLRTMDRGLLLSLSSCGRGTLVHCCRSALRHSPASGWRRALALHLLQGVIGLQPLRYSFCRRGSRGFSTDAPNDASNSALSVQIGSIREIRGELLPLNLKRETGFSRRFRQVLLYPFQGFFQ